MSILGFTLLFSCIFFSSALKSTYLTTIDKDLIKSVFNQGFSKGFTDAQSVALSVKGYALLEQKFEHENAACNLFKTTYLNSENINDLYVSSYGASLLKSEKCTMDVTKIKSALTEIDKINNIENLFKTVKTLSLLNLQVDIEAVKVLLDKFLKKDSSALSQAFSFQIAANIFKSKTDLKKYFVEIEDTIQQADESDNLYIYYEDGIYTTAFIVNSIFELCDRYEEAPPITIEKLVKLANFLISRRHSYNLKAVVELTAAIKALSRNKIRVPLVVSLDENSVVYKNDPKIKVILTNLWGDQISDAQLVAESVKNIQSSATIMMKKPLTYDSVTAIYELNMSSVQDQLVKGFYSVKLNAKVNETRFNGGVSATLVVKIISKVSIENIELSVKERDQITGTLNYKLIMGSLLSEKLNMNWHHRLDMKFVIREGQQTFKPHQVFVKLTHYNTKQEIIFVAEVDRNDVYKFNLDLDKSNKDFDNLSGDYKMELVIGDAAIESPPNWIFANVKLDMPSTPSNENTGESRRSVAGSKRSVNPRIGLGPTTVKPQIFHMFKPAEKRGGQLISTVFTFLCIVPPFIVMIVLWSLVGVNASNFQLSISPILFHVGIMAIFGLYYCYWSHLNMFTTLKYLLPLGLLTAFFGNRVLRQIAAKRKEL